jgi:hypothetical protein
MFAPGLPMARPRCTACTHVAVRGERLSRRNLRNEKVRDSSLLSSTIVMSEDMTGGLNLTAGIQGLWMSPVCSLIRCPVVAWMMQPSRPSNGVAKNAGWSDRQCPA